MKKAWTLEVILAINLKDDDLKSKADAATSEELF